MRRDNLRRVQIESSNLETQPASEIGVRLAQANASQLSSGSSRSAQAFDLVLIVQIRQRESAFCSVVVVIPLATKFVSDVPSVRVTANPPICHLGAIIPNQCKCLGVVNAFYLNPLSIVELAGDLGCFRLHSGHDLFRE